MSQFDSHEAQKASPYATPSGGMGSPGGPVGGPRSQEERTWALVAHLSPLTNFVIPIPLFNVIAPAIVWFLKRESMPFVEDQAREALNFQITVAIAGLVCVLLTFLVIGIFLGIGLLIYSVVMMVLAAKSSQDGIAYRYPMTLRLI